MFLSLSLSLFFKCTSIREQHKFTSGDLVFPFSTCFVALLNFYSVVEKTCLETPCKIQNQVADWAPNFLFSLWGNSVHSWQRHPVESYWLQFLIARVRRKKKILLLPQIVIPVCEELQCLLVGVPLWYRREPCLSGKNHSQNCFLASLNYSF